MVELLVERGVGYWNSHHKIYKSESIEDIIERKRQCALNPAYEPHYSETDLQHAAEGWATIKSCWFFSKLPRSAYSGRKSAHFFYAP
ncbi:MAG: hypothetical protein WDM76_18885 [Limisphaerales bacterium]